jgi:hypothetical protein
MIGANNLNDFEIVDRNNLTPNTQPCMPHSTLDWQLKHASNCTSNGPFHFILNHNLLLWGEWNPLQEHINSRIDNTSIGVKAFQNLVTTSKHIKTKQKF